MKYRAIAARIRTSILSGEMEPGDKLPTRRQLEHVFKTTPVTIQKALDLLLEQQLVVAFGRKGTFVADTLPCRHQYALTFPWPRSRDVSQLFRGLAEESNVLSNSERDISCFYNTNSREAQEYKELYSLVRNHKIRGLIFGSSPFDAPNNPLVAEPGLARVSVEAAPSVRGIPVVYPDLAAFLRESMEHLHGLGRRRIAHLVMALPGWNDSRMKLHGHSQDMGISLPEAWIQGASVDAPDSARFIVQMWLREPVETRPDAIVIHDDNLVPHATEGLAESGLEIPRDLSVVAHTNFPHPTHSHVPAIRLGFDIRELLATCVDRIDQQCRGEEAPDVTLLPVLGEEALLASQHYQEANA